MHDALRAIGIEIIERAGRAIALPADARETERLVAWVGESGAVLVPHYLQPRAVDSVATGSETGRPRVLVSTERMDAVVEVSPADLTAVAGAGVTVGALGRRLNEDGLFWPGAGMAGPEELVGDIVATAPGNWTMAGSILRRYLLAMKVVLADGGTLAAGARTVKSVTGYDLRELFVGSWGTLGIIVSLTLRLESLGNRESVLERYRHDFAGLPGTGTDDGLPDGAALILSRLKAEFDPDGVFHPIEAVWASGDLGAGGRD
jgi:glycolate oxidase